MRYSLTEMDIKAVMMACLEDFHQTEAIPFIDEQGSTLTHEDDDHIQVRGTGSDGLTKRQYTAHIFINAED